MTSPLSPRRPAQSGRRHPSTKCCSPCRRFGGSSLWALIGSQSLSLYYGLDFAVSGSAGGGGNRTAATGRAASEAAPTKPDYLQMSLTSLVDLPGYLVGMLLAGSCLGRRLTAAFSLLLGGASLLLTALSATLLPAAAATSLASALTLTGKTCASAAFVIAYLLAAELFPTAIRAAALGLCNLFARLGTMLAPLAETAPPAAVRLCFGLLAATAGLATLLLPERRGKALPA